MQLKESYLDRVTGKVEDLASRVVLLKSRFAKQKVSVKLEHYWELAYVRSRFAEFKWCVEQLEVDDDLRLQRGQEAIETAWKDLMHAMDMLLDAVPETVKFTLDDLPQNGPWCDRRELQA